MADPFEAYDDVEDVAERLRAADPSERRVAIIELGNSGDPDAVGYLAEMVGDPDPGVRQQTALALGEFDGAEAAAALVKLLVDPEQAVAAAAADSLAEFKDPASADAILPLVSHDHAFVRMGALRALKELRRKDALKPALTSLQDVDASVRVQAVGVIGFLKMEEAIPALAAAATDGDAHVRRAAVSALAFSNLKTAAELIVRAHVRRKLDGSRSCGRDDGYEQARGSGSGRADCASRRPFWQVRLKAIRSLGRLKIAQATMKIVPSLAHEQANLAKGSRCGAGRDRGCGGPAVSPAGRGRSRSGGTQERAMGDRTYPLPERE